ncbi:hypothetical protein NQ317_001464 [Molorchus minor]|uniref:Oxidation resistance protein 1 n=1 Tax=Molorchus minor TaxID=1323400 RepID=A0ABQ9JXM3_9CUCU|nr:hypothetical protein NQ317_001464 [Molorchus minor]
MHFVDDYYDQSPPSSCAFTSWDPEGQNGFVVIYYDNDLDGSTNSLTERRKAGPPENTTLYTEQQDSLMVKDETFPELDVVVVDRVGVSSVVTGDDAESVCSCTEREGDAFPKAFERELVTPTNLDDPDTQHRSLEERRKSLLDHHWAIPSRDRHSPIHLVDFGTGLFNKTPSEDSGSSGGPHSGGSCGPPLTDSPRTSGSATSTTASFFPTNIISSVGAVGAQVGASVGAMGAQVGASVGAMGAQVGASVGAMGAQVTGAVGMYDISKERSFWGYGWTFNNCAPSTNKPLRQCGFQESYNLYVVGLTTILLKPHIQVNIKERGFVLVEMDTELWSEEPTPSASRHGSQDEEISEITKESWELIKAPYAKIYNIIKTQTMSADGSDEGNNESLSIGAGDGKFGLWLDGDLYLGRSESCKTYGNDPLSPKRDFVVKTLECWAFINS